MPFLSFLYRKSRGLFLVAILAGMASGLSSTGLIAFINHALTQTRAGNAMVWGFAALCALRFFTGLASRIAMVRLGQAAIYEMRVQLPRQILAAPLPHLEGLGLNRLLAVLTEDIHSLAQMVVLVPNIFLHLTIVAASLVYLGFLSPLVMAGFLVLMVLAVLSYHFPAAHALKAIAAARESADTLMKHFHGVIAGVKELKLRAKGRKAFVDQMLQPTAEQCRQRHVRGMTLFSLVENWGALLAFIFIGLVVFGLPIILEASPSLVTGYVLVILFMVAHVEGLLATVGNLGQASVALRKINTVSRRLAGKSGETDRPAPPILGWRSLVMRGATYSYAKHPPVRRRPSVATPRSQPGKHETTHRESFRIGPIDLVFQPGELVFLIGGNGSGKTTFIKLLAGLYPAEQGTIQLDGTPVRPTNLEHYRQLFSVVFQDFHLFESLLGIETPELDRHASKYLRKLDLHRKVKIRGGRFNTTALSQGQRKRLALLAAYLEDRPFYIFDEWAADQDPFFKNLFYRRFLPALKAEGKTILVISHDDQFHHLADRLIKLDYGRVVSDSAAPNMPERVTQDRVAQDRVAQDRVTQDRVAQDRVAQDRVTVGKS